MLFLYLGDKTNDYMQNAIGTIQNNVRFVDKLPILLITRKDR